MKGQSQNIPVVESLRGIAATMVCLFHFTCGNSGFISNENWFKQIASNGWLGVEIFFVISGFVIPYSMFKNQYVLRHFPRFLLRRLLRLEPPYLLSILMVVILNYLSTLSTLYQGLEFTFDPIQIGLHLGYLVAFFPNYEWLIPVYWSLAIEFQYYLIVGLLFALLNHKNTLYFCTAALSLLVLALLIPYNQWFFHYSPYFVLGFILFRKMEHEWTDLAFYSFSGLALCLIFYQSGFGPMIAGLFPWALIRFTPKFNPPVLRFLGLVSYSIYLIHVPLGGRIINLSSRFVFEDWPRVGLVILAFFSLCLLAYGFYRLIEKPAIRWSKWVSI